MKKSVIFVIAAVIIAGVGGGYYFGVAKPRTDAIADFKKAYQPARSANKDLNTAIKHAEKQARDKRQPLTPNVKTELLTTIKAAKKVRVDVPKMPSNTQAIKKAAEKATENINYAATIKDLNLAVSKYQTSIKQNRLVTNPSQKEVLSRLSNVANVTKLQAATEENDPNESLNKAGGYTSAIFFTSPLVTEPVEGSDSLAKGTDGGGCIEVYKTKKDAEKRDTYLSAFDGASMLNPGSHQVVGTVLIRTSRYLKATQQQTLTKTIASALTAL